ncbi:MAG: hypothetical protein AABX66_02615 [Nanoarchaeota archaeon]
MVKRESKKDLKNNLYSDSKGYNPKHSIASDKISTFTFHSNISEKTSAKGFYSLTYNYVIWN